MIMQSTREATREELIQRINELQRENKYLRDENSIYRNETISKSVIRDKIEKFKNDSKNEKVFMTQSSQINASLISFCKELLGGENMIIQSTKEATRLVYDKEELIQRINELQDINEQHKKLNGELREEINQLKSKIGEIQ